MLRGILSGVAGYLVMALIIFGTFSALYMTIEADGAFKEGTWEPSMTWVAGMFVLGLIAAIIGGFVCAKIAVAGSKAPSILAVVVLALGLLSAIPALLQKPDPDKPARTAEVSNLDAMRGAEQPLYVSLLNPIIGLVGVLAGAKIGKKSAPAQE